MTPADASAARPTAAGAAARPPFESWPHMAWTPRAVVFDCDGTLVNTEKVWVETQNAYLGRHGVVLDPEVRRSITGASAEAVIGVLSEASGEAPEQVLAALQEIYEEIEGDHPALMPGAVESLRAIAAKVPVAIASNSPRELLDHKIEGLGVADVVTASVAVEDVDEPKPAPDMYARGAELLGAAPEDALAFEDTETGARAAASAGLRLIAIPSVDGQEPAADLTLASLEDPDLRAWIASWPDPADPR